MGIQEYKDIVATCAMVSTVGHMLSGMLICKDIYQRRTSKGSDPMSFIGGVSMCILMLRYALIIHDSIMINVNLFGITINTVYVAIYYFYSPNKIDILAVLGKAAVFVTIILSYAQIENEELIEFRYGVLTTTLFLLFVGSPLIHLNKIIETKSTEMLPFPLIFMGALVSLQWLVYGLIVDDKFVIFQNSISFILSVAQLCLFAIFPSTPIERREKMSSHKKEN